MWNGGNGGPSRGGALMRNVELLGLVLGLPVAFIAAPAVYIALDPWAGPLIVHFYGPDWAWLIKFLWGIICFVACILIVRISILAFWLLFAFATATWGPRFLPALAG